MVKSLKSWKLTDKPDILECEGSDVLGGIDPLKLVSELGFYSISELSTFFSADCQLVGYNVLYNICSSYNTANIDTFLSDYKRVLTDDRIYCTL
jgi:hypothetical protein